MGVCKTVRLRLCLENTEEFMAWVKEMNNIATEAEALANRVKKAIVQASELRKGAAPVDL